MENINEPVRGNTDSAAGSPEKLVNFQVVSEQAPAGLKATLLTTGKFNVAMEFLVKKEAEYDKTLASVDWVPFASTDIMIGLLIRNAGGITLYKIIRRETGVTDGT